MLVAERHSDDPGVVVASRPRDLASRLRRFGRRHTLYRSLAAYAPSRPAGAPHFTSDRTERGAELAQQLPSSDVINLHWIANFVDYASFFGSLPQRTPLVWTLHDTNPFTGGCHYFGACKRFNAGCGACPGLGSTNQHDLSSAIWLRKERSYSSIPSGKVNIVAPSRWLADEARGSKLLGRFPVSVIPYGIDTDVFRPRDKVMAREMFGIPQGAKVVLFAAEGIGEPRKGFSILVDMLPSIPTDAGIQLVSVGRCSGLQDKRLPGVSLGFIDNDRILSWVYSAADVYVIPTLDDNLPNTVIESMSCGTPVVGFNTGGVPDMVRDGISGFLVPKRDAAALRQAIVKLLEDSVARASMSANCRRIALEEYDLKLQAQRYLALYESLISRH
jgi:glycosyltransferase involved in cell wall biosynthesis